jgi:hypothetical protein
VRLRFCYNPIVPTISKLCGKRIHDLDYYSKYVSLLLAGLSLTLLHRFLVHFLVLHIKPMGSFQANREISHDLGVSTPGMPEPCS